MVDLILIGVVLALYVPLRLVRRARGAPARGLAELFLPHISHGETIAMAIPTSPAAATAARTARAAAGRGLPLRHSGWFFLAFLGLSLLAFWPGYLARLPNGGAGAYVHVHSALMTVWFGLLIAQPFLIRGGHRQLHRLLGRASLLLVPAIVVATIFLFHSKMPETGSPKFPQYSQFLVMIFGQVAIFAIAYVLAIAYRRQPALHARYMACTALGLVDPVVARLTDRLDPTLPDAMYQGSSLVVICLFVGALIVRERHAAKGRAAFPQMLALTVAVYALFFTMADNDALTAFAAWFRNLPLT